MDEAEQAAYFRAVEAQLAESDKKQYRAPWRIQNFGRRVAFWFNSDISGKSKLGPPQEHIDDPEDNENQLSNG